MSKVKIYWNGGEKELESGSYEAEKGQIPQDQITKIDVPLGATVSAYRDFGFAGPVTTLPGRRPVTTYEMKDHGLENAVSCLKVEIPTEGMDIDMDMDF